MSFDQNVWVIENTADSIRKYHFLVVSPVVGKGFPLKSNEGNTHGELVAIGEANAGNQTLRSFDVAYEADS